MFNETITGTGLTVDTSAGSIDLHVNNNSLQINEAGIKMFTGTFNTDSYSLLELCHNRIELKSGCFSIFAREGKLEFRKVGQTRSNFSVDEDGNVFCRSITADQYNGINTPPASGI